ncbi:MAG TPA: EpsG family protein [Polyangiaceae bacterium]|nr:EpsG family protein [Polyangiaceae bacterium]
MGNVGWFGVVALCAFMVGLRQEIGADWFTYDFYFQEVAAMTFREALAFNDPGYYGLNWIVEAIGGDVYWVNAICAVIVMSGVSVFTRHQSLPWVALSVAVPYLVIVVAMGYTRQGAALGFVLLGLTALSRGRSASFVAWVVCGALFHKSAVLVLPIAVVAATKKRLWTFVWVSATGVLGAYLLVAEESQELWRLYVEERMQSDGGAIRIAMNAVAAVAFLLVGKKFRLPMTEFRIWWWMSVFALVCIPLVFISSTAVDRVALYFIPVQLFALSRLPLLSTDPGYRTLLIAGVVGFYAAVLWVWLNFATHSQEWIPYRNLLLS